VLLLFSYSLVVGERAMYRRLLYIMSTAIA
jgi:hypothetical protein